MSPPSAARPFLAGLVVLVSGCVPYAVGTTAAPAPPRVVVPSATVQVAAGQPDLDPDEDDPDAEPRTTTFTLDNEARFGLDAHSDAGVRLVGASGVVATYKRRLLDGGASGLSAALLVGAGVVGLGSHGHVEATLVGSYPAGGRFLPYGGVRVQHLLPLDDAAPAPEPAVGGFAGLRIGEADLGISPELGLFYSPSDALFASDWVVVPSVTVHGGRLLRALGIGL
jgi:hypothetical protein